MDVAYVEGEVRDFEKQLPRKSAYGYAITMVNTFCIVYVFLVLLLDRELQEAGLTPHALLYPLAYPGT